MAPMPVATQIHNAEWEDAPVPSPTTVPAQANPSPPPMPKAALLSPGSDPGSSSGACVTPSVDDANALDPRWELMSPIAGASMVALSMNDITDKTSAATMSTA